MKLENTKLSNHKLVIDEFNIPIAIQINDEIRYQLYDDVYVERYVEDDGITLGGGIGTILHICRDTAGFFCGVFMHNGKFVYLKTSQLSGVLKDNKRGNCHYIKWSD